MVQKAVVQKQKNQTKKAPEDLDLAFWVQKIAASRPLKDFLIQRYKMSWLLDNRQDVSYIAERLAQLLANIYY